jgi:hypothetical protein
MLNLVIKNLKYKVRKLEEKLGESKENRCVCSSKNERTSLGRAEVRRRDISMNSPQKHQNRGGNHSLDLGYES